MSKNYLNRGKKALLMLWVRLTMLTSSLALSLKEIRNFESNQRKSKIMEFHEIRQAEIK